MATVVAEFELAIRASEDPSERLGDLQDTVWEEEIQVAGGHAIKLKMPIAGGSGPVNISLTAFLDNARIVMLQINKECEVYVYSTSRDPIHAKPIGRYAYFLITSHEADSVYIDPGTEDAEVVVCAIGD